MNKVDSERTFEKYNAEQAWIPVEFKALEVGDVIRIFDDKERYVDFKGNDDMWVVKEWDNSAATPTIICAGMGREVYN